MHARFVSGLRTVSRLYVLVCVTGFWVAPATSEDAVPEGLGPDRILRVATEARAAQAVPIGGTVVAHRTVVLAAQRSGRVVTIAGEEGDAFAAGTLLAALDDQALRAERRSAEAQWASAQAALHDAGAQYDRQVASPATSNEAPGGMGIPGMFDQLFTNPMASMLGTRAPGVERHGDIVARGARMEQARRALDQARFQIDQIDTKLRDSRSIAPFDGVITSKLVEVGDTVQAGQPLLELQDLSGLEIVVDVPTRLSGGLSEGVQVDARLHDAGRARVPVRLTTRYPTADPARHTVRMKFALPEGVEAAPGTYAEVWLSAGDAVGGQRIVVPESAVVERGGLPVAFVVDDEGRAELRLLRLGEPLPDGRVVINYGLRSGERVLDRPPAYLESGAEVGELPR
jgi:multidrug efflux pump subunit AcrA (membrane-fusion protein)